MFDISKRVIGFVICFGVGMLIEVIVLFYILHRTDVHSVSVHYFFVWSTFESKKFCSSLHNWQLDISVGVQLMSSWPEICLHGHSTMFLIGPARQVKNMFHEKRRIATIVYLTAIVVTLVVSLTVCILVHV